MAATVPEAPELAFTKLKALHDRTLAWNALRDPGVMACIPPADRPSIRAKTEGYYYRKASKDLYDIAFLVAHASPIGQALAIAERFGLRSRLEAAWHAPHRRLLRFAADMAEQDERTLAALRWSRPSPGEA